MFYSLYFIFMQRNYVIILPITLGSFSNTNISLNKVVRYGGILHDHSANGLGACPNFFAVGSERRMCFETECVMTFQGHPRSLILTPIESGCATSCWSSIVTLVITLPSFRYIAGFLLKRATRPLFHPNFGVFPLD